MQKQMRAIFILSGTAIGSGMISLPLVLAHIGVASSILIMLMCAFITYISALIRTELNLHSDCRFTLELVGLKFSGKGAALIGNISLRVLQFALLSAYICGLSAVIGAGSTALKLAVACGVFVLLATSSGKIISINQKLFMTLLTVILFSIICMMFNVTIDSLPHNTNKIMLPQLCVVLPTLFTSFGFQGSLHSITKFCNNDKKMIKTACLWGSFLPAAVYIAWIVGVMTMIHNSQPELFAQMTTQGIGISELIHALCSVSNATIVKSAVFIISVLAIGTSIIGVGLALVDDLDLAIESFDKRLDNVWKKRALSAGLAVVPAVFVAVLVPNAFVKVLSFAGMILAVIAIFLPTFLLCKIKAPLHFEILRRKWLVGLCVGFGVIVVLCELLSIIVPV
ncbi:MAG: hypothetical protein LBQ43_03055 [Holosporales bacterium]|jgi:tyrosine-specific transport protein|nr:hypothetical protein [Holosporales bacterium]